METVGISVSYACAVISEAVSGHGRDDEGHVRVGDSRSHSHTASRIKSE